MRCQFLVRVCAFFHRCLCKGEPAMKPDADKTPTMPRTARPIQPALVVYWPTLKVNGEPPNSPEEVAAVLNERKDWIDFAKPFGGTLRFAPRRAFKTSKGLDELIDRANKNSKEAKASNKLLGVRGYQPLDYKHYYLMSLPSGIGPSSIDAYCKLKSGLKSLGAKVYLSMPAQSAQASNSYVDAAPVGVGAQPTLVSVVDPNTNIQIDGTDEWIVDIEKAWATDLDANRVKSLPRETDTGVPPVVVVESSFRTDIEHGTAVAGIVLGRQGASTDTTVIGLAPGASFFKGACLESSETADPSEILASTILEAAVHLSTSPRGTGVILIEQQTWDKMPIETMPLEFAAIQTAVAAGHIVVQPAGNASRNLDLDREECKGWYFDANHELANNDQNGGDQKYEDLKQRSLNPNSGDPTSGAITVAAACHDPAIGGVERGRSQESNFGALVDCWSWGDSIKTLGVNLDNQGQFVTSTDPVAFNDTSGASAIIAGVILLMQQIRSAKGQSRLNAGQVRDLLRNTTTTLGTTVSLTNPLGTPGQNDLYGKYMPDLVALQSRVGTM